MKTKALTQTLTFGLASAVAELGAAIHHVQEFNEVETDQMRAEELADISNNLDAAQLILTNLADQVINARVKVEDKAFKNGVKLSCTPVSFPSVT